jgi:hypothetical protein
LERLKAPLIKKCRFNSADFLKLGLSPAFVILSILLGAAFLIAACLHWKCGDQIQGGFQVEEVPATEIVSEMQQAAGAICSF